VSAKLKLSPPPLRGRLFLFSLLGFLFLCGPAAARADSLEDSVRLLARKAASALHGVAATCEVKNSSTLQGKEFSNLSTVFQEELQRRGAKILPGDAAASVVLTVTENSTAYMGIVQIRRKESPESFMEILGPIEGAPVAELTYSLVLHKEFLFSQDVPMVDVVLAGDDRHAHALGLEEISSYELHDDRWVLTGTMRLPVHHSPVRELRGFLYFEFDTIAAYFPGEVCQISPMGGLAGNCARYPESMPVRSVSRSVASRQRMGSWFSVAQLGPEEEAGIIVTGPDGLARLYEDGPDPISTFSGWGSEIASVHTGCGSGWELLVTGKGDWTSADTLQAVEIRERQARSVSVPIELAGAVIALHSLATKTASEASGSPNAVAVVRNLQTGRYEAYLLSITCPN
jgi:hypothetical protein